MQIAQSRIQNKIFTNVTDLIKDEVGLFVPDLPSVLEKVEAFDVFLKQ